MQLAGEAFSRLSHVGPLKTGEQAGPGAGW